jgi:hypothetical protein
MPAIDTLTPRLIFQQDLALAAAPDPAPIEVVVLGAGTVSLTPIDAVLYTSFKQALNDAGAAAVGVNVGGVYWNLTDSTLHARLS